MALDNYAATPAVGYPMIVNFSVMNYSNTTTNKAKAAGNAKGKQFVKQPKSIAKKAAKYR